MFHPLKFRGSALLTLLILFLGPTLVRAVGNDPVQVSHHRGALQFAPENTFPAFEKSLELGADYVEFHVRRSNDGVYFILHDENLDRTTEGSGPIKNLSSDEIRKLDAGSWFSERFKEERIPTLDEFLTRFAGRIGLHFDAKDIPPEDLLQALKKHDALDSTIVYNDVDYLVELKSLEPTTKTLAPLSSIEEIDRIYEKLKPYAFDCSWGALSEELISHCHRLGVKVFSDAMGGHESREDYLQAIEWGIDLIQTDYPKRVEAAIFEYQMRNQSPQLIEGGRVRQNDSPNRNVVLESGKVNVGEETISFPAQTFSVPPEPPLEVADQVYRVGNATDMKSPSHWDGEGPRGPGTTRSYQRIVPGSLVVSSTDGRTLYHPDTDYIYDFYWGSIKPAKGGAIQPNSEVRISYRCHRCRYDSIVIDAAGKVSVIRGDSMPPDATELLLPNPPEIPALSLRLANVFTGWTNETITQGFIGEFVPSSGNRTEADNPQVQGEYHDIIPRDYLVRIVEPGPVGVAAYRVAASGDPYGVDPPRTLEEPVFGPVIQTSPSGSTPLLIPISTGHPTDYSLRIDFRPVGEAVLTEGDQWTLRVEPQLIFNDFENPTSLFPECEANEQRSFIRQTLKKLESGEGVRVVYLGESTTDGGFWPALFAEGLQDQYPRATVEAFNVGIGGETILGGLPRLEKDVLSKDPDVVIIEYVINDSSVNFRHDDAEGPGKIEKAHRELIEKIQDQGSIDIVYLTANFGNPAFVPAYTFENFRRTADLYQVLCREYECAFVDAFRVWENMGRIHGEYFLTRLKGNMVNHPFGNRDKIWSADKDNAEWLLKSFENQKD